MISPKDFASIRVRFAEEPHGTRHRYLTGCKCVPCRVGSQKMVEMLTGWTEGRASNSDLQLLDELSNAMRLTSICGLGQIVPAPIQSVLKHFREVVDAHIKNQRCPAGVCVPRRGTA